MLRVWLCAAVLALGVPGPLFGEEPHAPAFPLGSVALAQDDLDDRPRPPSHAREPRQVSPAPQNKLPPLLTQIHRELRVGAAWVVVQNGRQRVLRVGLEYRGRVVSAVTLEPGSGDPVPYEFRNSFYPVRPLTQAQIAQRLRGFRPLLGQFRLGESGVVVGGVVQVPILWNHRLVNYLRYDPRTGQLLTNESYLLEQNRSPLKTR